MSCDARTEWAKSLYVTEHEDYHRHFLLVAVEFLSLLVIMVVAVVANFATIITILRTPSLREKLGNILIINLCIMDLVTALGSMFFSLIDVVAEGYLLCVPLLCSIHGSLATLGVIGNFSGIVLIAIHRFLVVVAAGKVRMTMRKIWVMLAANWVVIISIMLPPILTKAKSKYTHGTHHCSPGWKHSCAYYIARTAVIYGVTFPIMTVCYSAIFWKVRKSNVRLGRHLDGNAEDPGADSSTRDDDETISTNDRSCSRLENDVTRSDDVDKKPIPSEQPSAEMAVPLGKEPNSAGELSVSFQVEEGNNTTRKGKSATKRSQEVEIRVALAGALMVITTLLCWSPYYIVNACGRKKKARHAIRIFAMWIAYSNSALDPLIYSFMNQRLRNAIKKEFSRLWTTVVEIFR